MTAAEKNETPLPIWQRLNLASHEFGYDTPKAKLLGEAALTIQRLQNRLRALLEYQGHVAINSVGDVRMQGKLMKAREEADALLRELGERE